MLFDLYRFGYLAYQSEERETVVITASSQKIKAINPTAALAPEYDPADKIAKKKNIWNPRLTQNKTASLEYV
jgi:hypothetical protein